MDIQPMDIIVTRTKSPISWWIRYKTGSQWSHVCLGGPNGTIFTTTSKGYKLVRAEKYLKGKTFEVWRPQNLVNGLKQRGINYSLELIGTPYSYTDILRLLWSNVKGKGAEGVKGNSKNIYCAESVCKTYHAMDRPLFISTRKNCNMVLPHECIIDATLKKIDFS